MTQIAIVDDEASVRSGLSNLLQSEGYSTLAFDSAETFLAAMPASAALAIVDIKLKGMSGTALFEMLQRSATPLPVIFISGHDEEAWQRYAGTPGAVAFLRKPIDIDTLLAHIQQALAQHEGQ